MSLHTVAERLGHSRDARLLIVNCDDFGSSSAANDSIVAALEAGTATSATLMTPCAAAEDAAHRSRGWDVGVHLTLCAEWGLPWTPLTNGPSLRGADGRFHSASEDVWRHARIDEVRAECRAQVARALEWGVDVTHVDTHMGTLLGEPSFVEVYIDVAAELGVPARLDGRRGSRRILGVTVRRPSTRSRRLAARRGVLGPDHLVHTTTPARAKLRRVITALPPGVTEVFLHPAKASDELRSGFRDWEGRVDDEAFLLAADGIQEVVRRSGVTLIGYGALRELQRAES